jgi:hypothetical protein
VQVVGVVTAVYLKELQVTAVALVALLLELLAL